MSTQSTTSTRSQSDVLRDVNQFFSRYLHCSDHQRSILAFWVLHTYCADAAQVTPYLSIQSANKQSGKTLCLQLLQLLCDFPVVTTGLPSSHVARLLNGPDCTLLIDECQATLGTRTRSKALTLRALLANGFQRSSEYLGSLYGQNAFRPKVFAGTGQLPEVLADRSIPIILDPLNALPSEFISQHSGLNPTPHAHKSEIKNQKSKMALQRFNLRQATVDAKLLRERLRAWAAENLPDLKDSSPYSERDFPPNLSPRRQDMVEPLLQLADAVGGEWPIRIREAVVSIFEEGTAFDLQPSLQILAELHRCFSYHGFPERLSTAVLLEWIQSLPAPPWDANGSINGHKLAGLLLPFEIRPRVQRTDKTNMARGYQLSDFLEPWRRHLGLNVPNKPSAPVSETCKHPPAVHEQGPPITNQKSKITNKNGHCYAVTHDVARSTPAIRSADKKQEGTNSFVPNRKEVGRALALGVSTALTRKATNGNGPRKRFPQSAAAGISTYQKSSPGSGLGRHDALHTP